MFYNAYILSLKIRDHIIMTEYNVPLEPYHILNYSQITYDRERACFPWAKHNVVRQSKMQQIAT